MVAERLSYPGLINASWVTTGSMGTARWGHTATLLFSGRVLVAGGLNGSADLNSAELYDPATGSWSSTGSLGARTGHTATFIAGIFGATSSAGTAVYINSSGQLGTTTSSKRFKEDIKPMDTASEALFSLKPVTFRYKKEIDPEALPQFGLVAEQVEKVNPDLVARDDQGKPYTVRYEAVNAMLLNEFLKEHCKVEALQASFAQQQKESRSTTAQQQNEIKALAATVKEQAAQIQKVSARLEASKPAPQVVKNP